MTVGTHICKIVLNHGISSVMNYRQSTSLLPLYVRHFTSSATIKEPSFTASYLVNACGLSPDSALSVSRLVNFKNGDIPDSVLSCLREFGFSETQLSKLVRKCPKVLLLNSERILLPKLEFLLSKGISRTEVAKIVSSQPTVILRSLEKSMVPFYDLFRGVLQSDEKISKVFIRCPRFIHSSHTFVKANINHLLDNGVPEAKIATLVRIWPSAVGVNIERFNEIVEFVKEKGLNPSSVNFVVAIAAVGALSRPVWEKKVLLFESWGWSKEDILTAFQKHPQCMMVSESKINAVMNYLIHEMGCEPSYIAQYPMFVSFSLEKRTIPRCCVIQVLLSKGMVKLTCLPTMLRISDASFEKKLMISYTEEAPYLLKIYREKMNVPK